MTDQPTSSGVNEGEARHRPSGTAGRRISEVAPSAPLSDSYAAPFSSTRRKVDLPSHRRPSLLPRKAVQRETDQKNLATGFQGSPSKDERGYSGFLQPTQSHSRLHQPMCTPMSSFPITDSSCVHAQKGDSHPQSNYVRGVNNINDDQSSCKDSSLMTSHGFSLPITEAVSSKCHSFKNKTTTTFLVGTAPRKEQARTCDLVSPATTRVAGKLSTSVQEVAGKKKLLLVAATDKTAAKYGMKTKHLSSEPAAVSNTRAGTDRYTALESQGFLIENNLGQGSYAVVKAALDFNRNRRVAVKKNVDRQKRNTNIRAPVRREERDLDMPVTSVKGILKACDKAVATIVSKRRCPKDYLSKFLPRELEMLRSLKHPNLIRCFTIMETTSRFFVIMEFAERGDLLETIRRDKRLDEARAGRYFYDAIQGLTYMHNKSVAHRDLKCENLLIDGCDHIRITDFGFARKVAGRGLKVEMSSTFCGSFAYAAPEILKGRPYNPYLSDIWSMGIVLFTMVVGKLPFDDRDHKHLMKLVEEPPVFPERERVSDDLKWLVHTILQPLPNRPALVDVKRDAWFQQHCSSRDEQLLMMSKDPPCTNNTLPMPTEASIASRTREKWTSLVTSFDKDNSRRTSSLALEVKSMSYAIQVDPFVDEPQASIPRLLLTKRPVTYTKWPVASLSRSCHEVSESRELTTALSPKDQSGRSSAKGWLITPSLLFTSVQMDPKPSLSKVKEKSNNDKNTSRLLKVKERDYPDKKTSKECIERPTECCSEEEYVDGSRPLSWETPVPDFFCGGQCLPLSLLGCNKKRSHKVSASSPDTHLHSQALLFDS